MGLLSAERARTHPERSILNRSLGHELIVSVDRISIPLMQGDRVLLCSDGLYGVLEQREIHKLLRHGDASAACKALIDSANARGTADNLTAAVLVMQGATPYLESSGAGKWREWLGGFFGRKR
jgi:protein phosphatase